ncbi:MAG: hypothetical protein H0W08_01650, partial [Acidobacteria bacterium]|nr:hypothetical protein [Acidobacteriota bacterium]
VESEDARAVGRLIVAVARRRTFLRAAVALAIGCVASAPIVAAASLFDWQQGAQALRAAGVVVVVTVVMALSSRWTTYRASALSIERARPSCLNVLVTAEELFRHPDRASPIMRDRVYATAARAVAGLCASEVVPFGRAFGAIACAAAVTLLLSPTGRAGVQQLSETVTTRLGGLVGEAGLVRVMVLPPAYTGQATLELRNPDRIDVLEGSRLRFAIPSGWRVRFGTSAHSTELIARDTGYFAVEEPGEGGRRRLIPLSVSPDHTPSVRIDAPAKDLLLPDGGRTIPVAISASDDLGLETLELRYTKVSGTGEQFEFVEGTVPVRVQRTSGRAWRADGGLALASLKLGPGDSLVYRAVARDQRPGDAGLAASDTYFVEIAGPGQVALEGVEMPPELERYAMSQQMIVMKLERLRVREAGMPREAVVEETASIGTEQRTVRANFVFLLGGHVDDEEVEAEQSHEIQEGRLENTARKDINAAISQMTRVEQGLSAVNTSAALPPARAAVESLQRAFGRSRYLLRSLAVRSLLDPARRLTGDLSDAADWRRVVPDADARHGEVARQMLDRLLRLAEGMARGRPSDPADLQRLAEAALAIDPGSPLWREVARKLPDANRLSAVQEVIALMSPETLRGAVPRTPLSQPESPIRRALDAERRKVKDAERRK